MLINSSLKGLDTRRSANLVSSQLSTEVSRELQYKRKSDMINHMATPAENQHDFPDLLDVSIANEIKPSTRKKL